MKRSILAYKYTEDTILSRYSLTSSQLFILAYIHNASEPVNLKTLNSDIQSISKKYLIDQIRLLKKESFIYPVNNILPDTKNFYYTTPKTEAILADFEFTLKNFQKKFN